MVWFAASEPRVGDDMIGSLFTWPFSGLLWVVKELEQAAREDRAAEGEQIREDLRLLYLQIENGEISEDDFAAREGALLDRLEELEASEEDEEEEDDDGEEEDEEEDEEEEDEEEES